MTITPRNRVDPRHTWNAESVFADRKAWEAEIQSILDAIPSVKRFQGTFSRGPDQLVEALGAANGLAQRIGRAAMYAGFSHAVETTDQEAVVMNDRALSAFGRVTAATSFVDPELISLGEKTLGEWSARNPRLAIYRHYFDNLFRKQSHVRSAEVEEIMGMLVDPFSGPANVASMLTNADFRFPKAKDSKGKACEVTQGSLESLLESPDPKLRRSAWQAYTGLYLEHRNTLAANLTNSIKQCVLKSRARGHGGALEAAQFADNIPAAAFHSVVDTFTKNLPIWHRYFTLRRRLLGLKVLRHCDMWAPLVPPWTRRLNAAEYRRGALHGPEAPLAPAPSGRSPTRAFKKLIYEQAVDLICTGLSPMGSAYVEVLRRGCLEERWVDLAPSRGKRSGAFSWGAYGTHPFIMMSFTGDVNSLSTLAHELGHSMHSYYAWKTQPNVYGDYPIFVAEVASNFHQAMVRRSLLQGGADTRFQISVLEEAMANFFRYFFIMPTLARFELETHRRVEDGRSLGADAMIHLMADLFREGYGGAVSVDEEEEGIIWATFPHLFEDYYVYQYATGISGANALSGRILRGEPHAVEDYIGFISAGSSKYPIDALRGAGVDLTSPAPIEEAFGVLASYIDQLERLTA